MLSLAAALFAVSLHTTPMPSIEPVMSPALRLNQQNRTSREQERREDERDRGRSRRNANPQPKVPQDKAREPKPQAPAKPN